MALSPTIPTSFVPKQPAPSGGRHVTSGNNIFLFISLAILAISVVLAGGIFFYAQYLTSVENAKGAELVAAQNNVSQSAVDDFVRLHNRFSAADVLITQHVALSQFLNLLGTITVHDVDFSALNVTVADDRSAQITMTGTAANFNALAAESTVFAQQKNITSAIFSGITVNKDNSIGFTLAANLTPALVIESGAPTTPALIAPAASTTASAPSMPATGSAAATAASVGGPTTQTTPTSPSASTTSP